MHGSSGPPPIIKVVNHGIILFILFGAFSQSFLSNAWQDVRPLSLLLLLCLTAAIVLIVHAGTWISSGWLSFSHPDRVTALYCGSQKTLAAGAPMAVAICSSGAAYGQVNVGLLLLPLLCYHPMQLFLAATILPKLEQ